MSYYSEVAIALSRDGYNKLKELYSLRDGQNFILDLADRVYTNSSKDKMIFYFDNYNHWNSRDISTEFVETLKTLTNYGFGYNIIDIGEDNDDINYEIVYGKNDSEQFQIISLLRQINIWGDFEVCEVK